MEKISIKEILEVTGGELLSGNTDQFIRSVCVDTRKITKEDYLFVALKGQKVDGHSFIKTAFELGAAACLVEENFEGEIPGPMIKVASTLAAMQDLAAYYRAKFEIPIIGVTGSVGKTTTKEMIAAALGENLKVFKTEGNYNGQIGLPLTIFNLNSSYQVAILEMGISELGEMDRLEKIAKPTIGVITNIGLSHIENFKSTEITCSEKVKIIKGKDKKLYVNGDSPLLANAKTDAQVIKFGVNGSYPYRCEDVFSTSTSTSFVLCTPELKENITIPCLGMHNVYNALAAIAVAMDMGIHLEDIKKGLLNFKNAGMRQQISKIGDITLIDDSYNASPDSVKSSVGILKNLPNAGKNIVVIADMLELGVRSEEIHFETGRYIAMERVDILITVGKDSKNLSQGAMSANQNIISYHCENNQEAIKTLFEIIAPNDKILIKGSRGMHTEEIVNAIKNAYEKTTL